MSSPIADALTRQMLIAIPDDGSPPFALGTKDFFTFNDTLRRAGYDPDHCQIGTASLAAADIHISWDRIEHVDFPIRA